MQLGLTGFGGPVALANSMRRDLVERYRWIDAREYDEGLAIATACPGPLAYKLGVYCGFALHGAAGAVAVGIAFAAAPFFIVAGIAALYVRYGSTWELRALFYGVGPVVIAIVIRSCWELGRTMLRGQWTAYALALVACVVTIAEGKELVAIFIVAGALGIVLFNAPRIGGPEDDVPAAAAPRATTRLPAIASAASALYQSVLPPKLFWFFFKTGLFVFGSGLVMVPFLKAYVVDQYHWLSNQAFLDAVAVGIISPGPVVITATFVGFLTGGFAGAAAATAGIFAPSVAFMAIGTPLLRRYRRNGRVQGFLRGITVAVVGVLVGTSYLLARSLLHDLFGAAILAAALVALFMKRRVPEPALVAGGAICGLVATVAR